MNAEARKLMLLGSQMSYCIPTIPLVVNCLKMITAMEGTAYSNDKNGSVTFGKNFGHPGVTLRLAQLSSVARLTVWVS